MLVNQSDLEARLQRSLTTEETNAFETINNALQATIEKYIGSDVEDVSETSRFYDGGVQHLKIDPCTSISSVIQVDDDETTVYTYDSSDYTIDPRNRTLKTMVRHRNTSGFINGINNIKVTAKFSIYGDEDMRNIVKDAILDSLVSEIESKDNILKESIEGYSVEFATTTTKDALHKIRLLFPEII